MWDRRCVHRIPTGHYQKLDDSPLTQIKQQFNTRIRRGERQGDTISPKLFPAAPESIFRRVDDWFNWEIWGLNVDGVYLSHLRFADDILIYELANEKSGFEDEQADDKGDDRKRHTINYSTYGTEAQHQRQHPRQGDSKKSHGRMDSIRQIPRHLQE